MKRHFLIALAAILLAFAGGSAFAASDSSGDMTVNDSSNDITKDTPQEKLRTGLGVDTYIDMDADGDKQVTKDEFRDYQAKSGAFDSWDVNSDGMIDRDEFVNVLFIAHDTNSDEIIEPGEWAQFPAYAGGGGNAHTPPVEE